MAHSDPQYSAVISQIAVEEWEDKMGLTTAFRAELDPGIAPYVEVLRAHGIHTTSSCEGGEGHSSPVPTIWFSGDEHEGPRALLIARENNMRVAELRRVWLVCDSCDGAGETHAPWWELWFHPPESV